MSCIDLAEVKRWFQRGDIKVIAQQTGLDPSYVSLVLSGKKNYMNQQILEKAIELAIQRKSSVLSKMERLKQISI